VNSKNVNEAAASSGIVKISWQQLKKQVLPAFYYLYFTGD